MNPRLVRPVLALAVTLPMTQAADEASRTVDKGLREHVEVNLVILDVQVLDRKGNPVPGLTAEDFDLSVDHRDVPIGSFDATCAERAETPALVLAFDYQHLDEIQRGRALESARRALASSRADGSEIMAAALTGGLRVEQSFTSDHAQIPAALRRMQYDPTLFAGNFSHMSEDGFVRGMTSLFDVAATIPRPKAILLYSSMRDVPLDEQYRKLAATAAASRSVIYPIDVRGLDPDYENVPTQVRVRRDPVPLGPKKPSG
jgi:VWFA-related protein